ncbi:hypothetical protein F2Q68_00039091 [Brassica cretica]|uniref:Uncharacterized protein n=1 Tax=Brassica cretica TaxID=69181 RepID=A0A8S9MP01_BRACR|nr:hypothetical protein F2Q68_00039091 [Brassica cretica]
MPSSTRSNKETQLLFSPDPASLERSIRKEARSSSIDNNTCSSLDFVQPPSTQTLVPSTDTRSPPSTEDTHLPSTDIFHPTSIDSPPQTSIDIESRDMVATLILVRDDNGDLHDQDGHLRNAAGREAARRRFRSRKFDEFRRIALVSIDARLRTSIDVSQSKSIDRISRASTDDTNVVIRILQCQAAIDRQPPAPIDRRAPITYQVQMPKIDVARLNAIRPKPQHSENPQKTVRTPSDDGEDSMEEDRVPTGKTLRRRKEKVAKHLKRGANEKEKENFRKRVFRIPLDKPFEEAYYTHRVWMFRNSGGIVRDLEVQIGNALVPVDFHVLDIKLNWNSSLLLGRAFLSTVGAVCNL